MKSFTEIREARKMVQQPSGQQVFSKKVGKHKVTVNKTDKGFCAYIDGDKLDTYKTQKQAESMGVAFAKEM